MNRLISIAVFACCVLLPSTLRSQSIAADSRAAEAYLAGREAGRTAHTFGVALLGVTSGLVAGVSMPILATSSGDEFLFGGTSAASVAVFVGALRLGTHVPHRYAARLEGQSRVYSEQFRKGYADEVHRRRLVPAIVGGALGAAVGGTFVYYAAKALAN